MGIKDTWAVKQLVTAAQELHASRLYERYDDGDYFLVHTPRLDDPALAVIMGNGGQTFGLNLYLGPDAQASYEALYYANSESQARMAMMQSQMLGYCMVAGGELSFEARKWLKQAKAKPERGRLYPDPMYIEPGKVPVVGLKDKQTQLLLHLTRGILAASRDKGFDPCGLDRRGRVLAVTLTQERENPRATVGWEQGEPGAAGRSSGRPAAGEGVLGADGAARPAFDLKGLKPSGDSWLVSMMPAPGYVQDDDRQPFMLLVCSEQTQGMWPCLVMGAEGQEVVDQLAALMRGEPDIPDNHQGKPGVDLTPPPPGLPDAILTDSASLHRVLDSAFSPLGIDCVNGEDQPAMQAMFDEFRQVLDMSMGDGDLDAALIEQLGDKPEDDDLHGWKRVDGWLKDMIYAGFENDERFCGARALTRYFGRNADPERLLTKYRQQMIVESYALWFTFDYRSARKRPTLAEQWLDDPSVPDVIKPLITAIQAQSPGLYRVEAIDDEAGKITLADLFTGGIEIATDFALSTCVEPGWVLAGKLVPVGDFRFFYAGGPLATAADITEMLDYLRPAHNTPSPDFFRDQPHRLGHLWDVLDLHRSRPRNLFNSDGDELLFHEATLECRNRKALERKLAKLPGWEPDGDSPADWVWLRPGQRVPDVQEPDAKMIETHAQGPGGMATVLAQLEVHDEHLTLHTNSRERLDRACADLTTVRGVKLTSVQTHAPGDPTSADHDDVSDEPIKLEPEDIEAMRDYLTHYYRQWLDQPIPALDDQTPRQAATQPGLRSQLAAMIRAMPDPADRGTTGITLNAPRQMLLSELGLDAESSH